MGEACETMEWNEITDPHTPKHAIVKVVDGIQSKCATKRVKCLQVMAAVVWCSCMLTANDNDHGVCVCVLPYQFPY